MEMVLFLLHLLVFMLPEAFIYSKSMVLDYNRASPQIYWHTFIQILSSKSVCTSSLSTAGGAQDFRWEQGPAVVMVSGILETLDVNWWKERERERRKACCSLSPFLFHVCISIFSPTCKNMANITLTNNRRQMEE